MNDNFKHKGQRKKLVQVVAKKGIIDKGVLKVIETIPRHLFIPDTALHKAAYDDIAFPIGAGQTISQPYTVAFQTQLLEVKKMDKVLEIGTGSGYQTAVLLEMGARVFSIERQKSLFDRTRKFLPTLNYNAKLFYGDGYQGLKTYAPFDKIIVTAGAPFVPEQLKEQLKVGGILVIPVGQGEVQKMLRVIKIDEDNYDVEEFGMFKFVPLLEKKAND